jgi:hypothetical protein
MGKGAQGPTTYAAAVGGGTSNGPVLQNETAGSAADGDKEGSGAPAESATGAVAAVNGGSADDDEQELVEEDDDGSMQVDSETAASISKLPKADQRRLRAMLRTRSARDREAGDAGGGGSQGRDRERSPRPTKTSGGKDDL